MSEPASAPVSQASFSLRTLFLVVTACAVFLGSFWWLPPFVIGSFTVAGSLAVVLLLINLAVQRSQERSIARLGSTDHKIAIKSFRARFARGMASAAINGLVGFLLPIVAYVVLVGGSDQGLYALLFGATLALIGLPVGGISGLLSGFTSSKPFSIPRSLLGLSCALWLQTLYFVTNSDPHSVDVSAYLTIPGAIFSLLIAILTAASNAKRALKVAGAWTIRIAIQVFSNAASTSVPATIQTSLGIAWLLPFCIAVGRVTWGGGDLSLPTLTLSMFFLWHAVGISEQQPWAKIAAWASVTVSAGLWLTGLVLAYPIFVSAARGDHCADSTLIVVVVWLATGLLFAGAQFFVAASTRRWPAPIASQKHSPRVPFEVVFALQLALLAPVIDAVLWQLLANNRNWSQLKTYANVWNQVEEQKRRPLRAVQLWVQAFERGDEAAITQAETVLQQHLLVQSGATVSAIRFQAKNGPEARRVRLYRLLAQPTFAVRSHPDDAYYHCQAAQQAYAILVDETNSNELRQAAVAVIWNQTWNKAGHCSNGSVEAVEAALEHLKELTPIVAELERIATDADSPPEKREEAVRWLQKLVSRDNEVQAAFRRVGEPPALQSN